MEALHEAHANGRLATVRICFGDYYGVLRGRRIPAGRILDAPTAPQGFCSAALVWDYQSGLSEATPFSNFETGYGDSYWHLDPSTAVMCGWAPGEALMLGDNYSSDGSLAFADGRCALRRVLATAPDRTDPLVRFGLQFRVRGGDGELHPGGADPFRERVAGGLTASGYPVLALHSVSQGSVHRLVLGELPALAAADAALVARSAMKEVALQCGRAGSFMARLPESEQATTLELAVRLDGAGVDLTAVSGRLADLSALARPTAIAYKRARGDRDGGVALRLSGEWLICEAASSEANPYLAAAALLAAVHADAEGGRARMPSSLAEAVGRLDAAAWASEWFDRAFLEHACGLAGHEAGETANSVSEEDWERYGRYL